MCGSFDWGWGDVGGRVGAGGGGGVGGSGVGGGVGTTLTPLMALSVACCCGLVSAVVQHWSACFVLFFACQVQPEQAVTVEHFEQHSSAVATLGHSFCVFLSCATPTLEIISKPALHEAEQRTTDTHREASSRRISVFFEYL